MRVKQENAFGQENLAYLLHKESFEVIERNDGFVNHSQGARMYFSRYKDWPRIEKEAVKLARGRVLDVGCGAGRVSLYLQGMGCDVTGIDNSPGAFEVSRRRGVRRALNMSIEEVGKFGPDSFDTIVMFGNNFGLFGGHERAKKLLKRMYRITSGDAVILAESRDPYDTKDPAHLAYHRRNRERGRMGGQVRIRVRFRNYTGNWFDYLLASRSEMVDIARGTGWKVRRFIERRGLSYIGVFEKERPGRS